MALGTEVGLGPDHIVLHGDPAPLPKTAEPPAQFSAHIFEAKWLDGSSCHLVGPSDSVLDGDSAQLPLPTKKAEPPTFGPSVLGPNGSMDQDGTWHGGGPWSRPHCVRWGPSSPSPKGGTVPQFYANFYCGQTAGCIRIPLGTEVGLCLGVIVLDGVPAPPP